MNVSFGYAITYVDSVEETLKFYEAAFSLKIAFLHPGKDYGELSTGSTKLAFTSNALAKQVVPTPYLESQKDGPAPGFEFTLTTKDVDALYAQALKAGAESICEPVDKDWGQRVAYVKDLNGVLVGLATPMGGD